MFMNKKAISTLTLIILIVASAIVGGIISYMLTIAYYVEMGYNIPENTTTLAITDVYINPEDATSFRVTILNPSFSISNATVTRIAVSVANETDLYEVVETQPPIGDGLVIPRGEAVNITCSALQVKGKRMRWGEFAYMFAGQPITIHVFSENSSSANRMEKLPFVELEVTPIFGDTFKNFAIKLKNHKDSETALTINSVELLDVEGSRFTDFLYRGRISLKIPELPVTLEQDQSITLTCQLNWFGINKTKIFISTEQGYRIYTENITLQQIYFEIKNVTFDVDYTDRFNVTMVNYQDSAKTAIIERIEVETKDGNVTCFNVSMPLFVGMEWTYTCMWDWKNYRGKELNVTVFLKQDINQSFQKKTPQSIILKVINSDSVFSLRDKGHFNITLQNHPSSLETVNITRILVKEINENITLGYSLEPGNITSFYCNASNLEDYWRENPGGNLTLIVYYATETITESNFTFTFTLPKAELNIISVEPIADGETKYLNITIENSHYSLVNLTVLRVILTYENQTEEMQLIPGKVIMPGQSITLHFMSDWEKYQGKTLRIEIITEEGIKAVWTGILS